MSIQPVQQGRHYLTTDALPLIVRSNGHIGNLKKTAAITDNASDADRLLVIVDCDSKKRVWQSPDRGASDFIDKPAANLTLM